MSKVTIIGAGLSGLVCGMRLSKAGFEVEILEALNMPGGMLQSARRGTEYIELIPHHLRRTDRALLSLSKELGLDSSIKWYDSFWYGRASRKKLGYFDGGFASLINVLILEITDNGGRITYSANVSEITKAESGYKTSAILSDTQKYEVLSDYVIFTGSARSFVNVSHGLPLTMNVRDQLMNITYISKMCLGLLVKKLPNDAYIQKKFSSKSNLPFERVVNHSACFKDKNYGGEIIYLVGSCSISDPLWVASDAEVMNEYVTAYRKIYPLIRKSDIKSWRLNKVRYAVSDAYPSQDLTEPLEDVYVCSSALTKSATTEVPENHMDGVVVLATSICQRIITKEEQKVNEHEESTIITAI
ncbi:MAG: FAD-dependent oxidoreductase [Saccharofermentans sp.]|nr:FAD-dependent oxidoreductase [Saccharofermentans sp.]